MRRAGAVRVIALMIAILVSLGAWQAAAASPTPTAGPRLAAGYEWGQKLDAYDGQVVHYNGENATYVSGESSGYGIKWQCVELVQRYYAAKWGYLNRWGVWSAYELFDAAPEGVGKRANGAPSAPVPGDILVFNGEGVWPHGHAALIVNVSNGRVTFVQQNVGRLGRDSLPINAQNVVNSEGRYPSVKGWLHSEKDQHPASSTAAPGSSGIPTPDFSNPTQPPSGQLNTPSATTAITAPHILSGTVYVDSNRNGKKDGTESGLASVSISVSGPQSASARTDATGHYAVGIASPGLYTVTLRVPAGYVATTMNPLSVSISLPTATADFGIAKAEEPTPTAIPSPRPTPSPTPVLTVTPTPQPPTPTPVPTATLVPLPAAPSNLNIFLHGGAGIVHLSWNDNSIDESGFAIHLLEGSNDTILAEVVPDTSYYEVGMTDLPDSDYCFIVYAVNLQGGGAPSNKICNSRFGDPAIVAPSNVTAEFIGPGHILVSWQDNSDNEEFFQIWVTIMHTETVGTATGTSFVYTAPGGVITVPLCFSVTAVSGTSESESLSGACYDPAPPSAGPPAAPTNSRFTVSDSGELTIEWTDNSDNEDGFEIYLSNSLDGPRLLGTVGSNSTSFTLNFQDLQASYFCIDVVAFNDAGYSTFAGAICNGELLYTDD